jgi:hypothetical protein
VATPAGLSEEVERVVEPSVKVTVPVGATPPPPEAATVAVKVMD